MEQLLRFLPERLIESLGWTITHSLWQASVIGILYVLTLNSFSVYRARSRYFLSLCTLMSILVSSVITFILIYRSRTQGYIPDISMVTGYNDEVRTLVAVPPMEDAGSTLLTFLKVRIKDFAMHFNLLIFIWMAGVLVFTLKTAGGMYLVNRYKTRKVMPVGTDLANRFDSIRQKMSISRPVRYLTSGLIEVPMVIGLIKPVILVPAAIISGLPLAQMEAIIIHELAHIARHDYLINLMQSIIEILFFYHPAVWIISKQARIEREHCCDDISVSACGTAGIYARALASLSALHLSSPLPCMALAGSKKLLYNRIKRLLKRNKMKNTNYDKLTAGVLIMAATVIIILGTSAGTRHNLISAKPSAVAQLEMLPVPAGKIIFPVTIDPEQINSLHDTSINVRDNTVTKTIHHQGGKEENIDITIRNGIVQELIIDGNRVPEERMDEYRELVNQTIYELQMMKEEYEQARQELNGIDFIAIQDELRKESENLRAAIDTELEQMRQELKNIQVELPELPDNLDSLKMEMQQAMRDIKIDKEEISKAMELAMEEAKDALEAIDMEAIRDEMERAIEGIEKIDEEAIRQEMEKARQSIEFINQEKITQQVEEAIRQIEQVDIQEIQKAVQEAIQDVNNEKAGIEKEKEKIDEMIREIEKLELKER